MGLVRWSRETSARLRLIVSVVILVGLVATLAYVLHLAFSGADTQSEADDPRTMPATDVNPYGANFFLAREVEPWKLEKTLSMAAEAGIGWVKQQFPWEELEPERKGEYLDRVSKSSSWAKYDLLVDACEAHGLKIVARLDRPPDWTRQDNTYQEAPPDNLEDFGDFVYQFVEHYEGRIDYIQIWNEPNIFPEWGNQPVDPAGYTEMLKIAYTRAKEANPNVYVLSAPLAITLGEPHPEEGQWRSMSDLQYLEGMYEAGASDYFDILSANAFGMDRPPDDPPDPNVLNFQRVLLQREIMVRYGDDDKPVWFDEYGWNASPDTFAAEDLIWQRVSESLQAEYTVKGIQMARESWSWAGVFMIWYFRQVGNISPESSEYYFRMVDPDFTPRLVYFAVQEAARPAVPGLGLYEETHSAVKPQGNWRNVIDEASLAGAYITSDVPGDSITFSFNGTRLDLRTRRGPSAGRLLVVLDGRPAPGLKADEQGRSYVDLYSPTVQINGTVTLVDGIRPGQHTVTITVAEDVASASSGLACAVDAFEVLTGRPSPFPTWQVALILLALGGDGWLVWRAWRRVRWVVLGGR